MARKKLPWLADASTKDSPSIKRESPKVGTPPRQRSIRDWQTTLQTPSSRPRTPQPRSKSPQTAITAPEPMREGFEADDIWMMVEDEFNEVAKAFSAHLHQAAYERRVKAAKEAPPKSPPVPASPMSKATKRRLGQDMLHARQAASLTSIGIEREAAHSHEPDDDPWRGTYLSPLVSAGNQRKVSLKGLDRIPSFSRAAQGFGRAAEQSTTKSQASATAPKPARTTADGDHASVGSQSDSNTRPELEPVRSRSVRELPAEPVTKHVGSDRSSENIRSAARAAHLNGNALPEPSVPKKRTSTSKPSFRTKKVKKEEVVKEDLLEMPMW
jgi:hypothetical protein